MVGYFLIGGYIFQLAALFSNLCFGIAGMTLVTVIFIFKKVQKKINKKASEAWQELIK